MEGLKRGGRIVRSTILPTPKEETDPLEGQSAHGGLRGFALVALLLRVDPCPEGMPERCSRPLDKRLSEECRALEAQVDPRFSAAALGHWGDSGIVLEFCGGGRACALLAAGDQEAGSEDRAST